MTRRNLRAARKAAPHMEPRPRGRGKEETAVEEGAGEEKPDDGLTRLLKLIPGEAALFYAACLQVGDDKYLPPTAFVLGVALIVMTMVVTARRHDPPIKPEPIQYAIRIAAFAAWAFTIFDPTKGWLEDGIPHWIPAVAVLFIPPVGALVLDAADAPAAGEDD